MIKMAEEPSYFYKYRAFVEEDWTRTKQIFTQNKIYFASRTQFNDPFDCRFNYSFDAKSEEVKRYLRETLKHRNPDLDRNQRRHWIAEKSANLHSAKFKAELTESTDKRISEIGIFSMSRVKDNILMWSHYANSHTGFCLQFLDDETDEIIGPAQEVTYSHQYPVVNPIKDSNDTRLQKSLLQKADFWSYEKEWRILDVDRGCGVRRFPPHLLVGVIFGCRIKDNHKSQIAEWCASRKTPVRLFQAVEASGSYELQIKELQPQ